MRQFIWHSVVVLLALHYVAAAEAQQPIAWQQDLEAAKRLAAETNRLVVVHFWAPWCDPCMALEQSVFNQPGMAEQLEAKFVPVKLNVDQNRPIAAQYGVRSIPTDVIIKPDGSVVGTTPSPQLPHHYLGRLNQIAASAMPAADVVAAPTTPPAPAATPGRPQKEDRYAGYYREQGMDPNSPPAASSTPSYQAPPATDVAANQVPMNQPLPASPAPTAPAIEQYQQPQLPGNSMPSPPPWAAAAGTPQQAPPMAPMQQPTAPQMQPQQNQVAGQTATGLPPGSPPLGLDGYCPVQLIENWTWVVGDRQWGAIHEGRTYLFAGPRERQLFLENPHKYAPVEAGDDAVVLREQGVRVPGRRECGGVYDGRLYLFSNEQSYAKFEQAAKLAGSQQRPSPYAVPIMQAMRQ
ncbi:MAG: thioredoxin family protein [Pirellulales bacterium]|nr:thioredoxin family protein [Pirellulales bacterium]